jgi:hypothetical protein
MSTGTAEVTEISGVDLKGTIPCEILQATFPGTKPCPRAAQFRIRMKCEHFTEIRFMCEYCLGCLKKGYLRQNPCQCTLSFDRNC